MISAFISIPLLAINVEETIVLDNNVSSSRNGYETSSDNAEESSSLLGHNNDVSLRDTSICRSYITRLSLAIDNIYYELTILLTHTKYIIYLLSSSVSSFTMAIFTYGSLTLQLIILNQILTNYNSHNSHTLSCDIICQSKWSILLNSCYWLGGILTIIMLSRISILALQLHGFIICAVIYFTLATINLFTSFIDNKIYVYYSNIILFCVVLFVSGAGPSPSTFLIPSVLFPIHVRSTVNGIISSIGRVGSLMGVILIELYVSHIAILMCIFGVISIAGSVFTLIAIRQGFQNTRQEIITHSVQRIKLNNSRSNNNTFVSSMNSVVDDAEDVGNMSDTSVRSRSMSTKQTEDSPSWL
jgi:hypothetical protein